MNKKVLVTLSTFAEYGSEPLKILQESGFKYEINSLGRRLVREDIIKLGHDCQGIIAGVEPYDQEVLDALPNLQCISRCGVGVDNIDHQTAKEKNIVICNTPDVVIQPVAELTIAMIFDLLRKITFHTTVLKSGQWSKQAGGLLKGRKVGVLGLGRIGKKVAEMLKSLEAEVYGSDLFPDKKWAQEREVTIVPLNQLFKESDILTIHLAKIKDGSFVLGEKEIQLMKKGSMIINTSRGEFINEEDLYKALQKGQLSGAGLDVFSKEPYIGHLYELDNVIVTPHIATLTRESRLQMETEAVENLISFFKSKS